MPRSHCTIRLKHGPLILAAASCLSGCATLGSMLSPYSETFSCKNDDHGQCIHPSQAYEDAVAGAMPRSDPAVTNDRKLLEGPVVAGQKGRQPRGASEYAGYRDSVYRELKGLIDAPVTPMLKPPRTVRTLILPYADRQRPDRLYMPRFVYSVVDRPVWVIGDSLVAVPGRPDTAKVLDQVREHSSTGPDAPVPADRKVQP